jgi:hypothetical protein
MWVTTKKYSFGKFLRKLAIFAKTVGHPWIVSKNLRNLKTHKNSYMGPLCITDLEYGGQDQEIWSFGQFMPQTGNFC